MIVLFIDHLIPSPLSSPPSLSLYLSLFLTLQTKKLALNKIETKRPQSCSLLIKSDVKVNVIIVQLIQASHWLTKGALQNAQFGPHPFNNILICQAGSFLVPLKTNFRNWQSSFFLKLCSFRANFIHLHSLVYIYFTRSSRPCNKARVLRV